MEKIVLFGTGQIASVAYSYLNHDSKYEVAGFTVDRKEIKEDTLFERLVIPFDDIISVFPPSDYKLYITVGYINVNKLRAERYQQAKEMGYQLISYVHPKAVVLPDAAIGENCTISPNSVILPYAQVGNNVHIGTGVTIGHHSVIGDHCWITAGALVLGSVTVEPYCLLGGNAIIRNGVTIARECIIGAGALILEDTRKREVYMGIPAERLPISSNELPKLT